MDHLQKCSEELAHSVALLLRAKQRLDAEIKEPLFFNDGEIAQIKKRDAMIYDRCRSYARSKAVNLLATL